MSRPYGRIVRYCAFICLLLVTSGASAGALEPIDSSMSIGLSGRTLDNTPWSLDQQRGRVVMIHFWASWCQPCLEEMPAIRRLEDAFSDQPFEIIGVDVGEPQHRAAHWAKLLHIDFPVLLDEHSEHFHRWSASVLPTTYILDSQGTPVYRAQGPLDWQDPRVIQTLSRLIDSQSGDNAGEPSQSAHRVLGEDRDIR